MEIREKIWNELGEIMFAIMSVAGFMFIITTIATHTVDILTFLVGISSISLWLVILMAKRKNKMPEIKIVGYKKE